MHLNWATPGTARPWPAAAERPPLEIHYGTELPRPFLPVLPPAAAWDLPDDMKDQPETAAAYFVRSAEEAWKAFENRDRD